MPAHKKTDKKVEINLEKIAYPERQLIIVVPDEVKAAEEEEIQKALEKAKKGDSKTAFSWDMLTKVLIARLAPKLFIWGTAIELAIEAYEAIKKLNQKKIDILTVSSSTAKDIEFPPGHPQNKGVYAGNPVSPRVYFPLGDFHRMMLESKFAEAVFLLMSLGANNIKTERIQGWGQGMSAGIDIETPTGEGGAAGVSSHKSTDTSVLFQATLDPNGSPKLQDDLVWYNYEPTWRMIAEGRIKYGLREFSLNVSYHDDYGINAGLMTALKGAGLKIGGHFENHQSTVWRITGTFSDKSQ